MSVFVLFNNHISIKSITIAKGNVAFVFTFFYARGGISSSSEESKTRLMRLMLLLAVETELANWLDNGIDFHVDHCTAT